MIIRCDILAQTIGLGSDRYNSPSQEASANLTIPRLKYPSEMSEMSQMIRV